MSDGLELKLEVGFKSVSDRLDHVRKLAAMAYGIRCKLLPIINPLPPVTGKPFIADLGAPDPGFTWVVRSINVVPVPAVPGSAIASVANVNVDLYLTSGTGQLPNPPDWYSSSSNSANPGSIPVQLSPVDKEMVLQSGDHLVVVCSGAGVTTGSQISVVAYVDQLVAFSGMSR